MIRAGYAKHGTGSLLPVLLVALVDGSTFVIPGDIISAERFKTDFVEVDNEVDGALAVDGGGATTGTTSPAATDDDSSLDQRLSGLEVRVSDIEQRIDEAGDETFSPAASVPAPIVSVPANSVPANVGIKTGA